MRSYGKGSSGFYPLASAMNQDVPQCEAIS